MVDKTEKKDISSGKQCCEESTGCVREFTDVHLGSVTACDKGIQQPCPSNPDYVTQWAELFDKFNARVEELTSTKTTASTVSESATCIEDLTAHVEETVSGINARLEALQ